MECVEFAVAESPSEEIERSQVTIAGTTSENLIDGDYYQGSHGPTIRFNALSMAGVEWMHRVFAGLSDDKEEVVDLAAMPELAIQGVSRLMLMLVAEQPSVVLQVRSHEHSGDVECEWRQDSANWRRTAALLEPFLAGCTGHQYLTQEQRDAALVEFSFGEFGS